MCLCDVCVGMCVCVCVFVSTYDVLFATCLTEAGNVSDVLREYQEEKAKYLTRGEMKKKGMLKQENEVRNVNTGEGGGGRMWYDIVGWSE